MLHDICRRSSALQLQFYSVCNNRVELFAIRKPTAFIVCQDLWCPNTLASLAMPPTQSQQMPVQQVFMHDCMCDVLCAGKSAGMILRQINAEALAEAKTLHLEQTCDMMKQCSLNSHSHTFCPAPLQGPLPATDQHYTRYDKKKKCILSSFCQPTRPSAVL